MTDAEFRRRAHEFLAARHYDERGCIGGLNGPCPGEDLRANGRAVPCSHDCEVVALLAAGPEFVPPPAPFAVGDRVEVVSAHNPKMNGKRGVVFGTHTHDGVQFADVEIDGRARFIRMEALKGVPPLGP